MPALFKNNAITTLAGNVAVNATTIEVADASVFPTLSSGDWFYVTLETATFQVEVVKVTGVTGNLFTVIRGQDGTTAQAFTLGDHCEARVVDALLADLNLNSGTVNSSFVDAARAFAYDYDCGTVVPAGGSPFVIENTPETRIDLSQGPGTVDLGDLL